MKRNRYLVAWIVLCVVSIGEIRLLADSCDNNCFDYQTYRVLAATLCSKNTPLTQAKDDSNLIWFSAAGDPLKEAKDDGMNMTGAWNQCVACDVNCPDSPPSYGWSQAVNFVLPTGDPATDCVRVFGPFQRTICKTKKKT